MNTDTPAAKSLANSYLVFAGRSTRRFLRTTQVVGSTVLFPLLLMLSMSAVFSSAVEGFSDQPYAQRLIPGLVVAGLMFGSIGTATGFFSDLHDGFMDRIRSLPVANSAPLVGTVAAELVRAALATTVLVGVGYLLGFRFESFTGAIGFVCLVGLAAVSIIWIGLSLATVAKTPEGLSSPLGALFLVLLFFSGSFVPLEGYPSWAQPLVEWNPASAFVSALDDLAQGLPAGRSVLIALGWAAALILVFGFLAIRGMKQAERG